MNRRSFITDMLKAGVACTFLPGAGRIWKPTYKPVRFIVPEPVKIIPFWVVFSRRNDPLSFATDTDGGVFYNS